MQIQYIVPSRDRNYMEFTAQLNVVCRMIVPVAYAYICSSFQIKKGCCPPPRIEPRSLLNKLCLCNHAARLIIVERQKRIKFFLSIVNIFGGIQNSPGSLTCVLHNTATKMMFIDQNPVNSICLMHLSLFTCKFEPIRSVSIQLDEAGLR